jgi:hypothetical protein
MEPSRAAGTKKEVIVLCCALLLLLCVWPLQAEENKPPPVVLGVQLGAPRGQIEALFAKAGIKQTSREADVTWYEKPLVEMKNGEKTGLVFYEDKLAKVHLDIAVDASQIAPYLVRYQELQQTLIEQYGQPTKSIERMDENYRQTPLLALKSGKAAYSNMWQPPNFTVGLILTGENSYISFFLTYEYSPLFKKYIEKRNQQEKEGR